MIWRFHKLRSCAVGFYTELFLRMEAVKGQGPHLQPFKKGYNFDRQPTVFLN